MLGLPDVEESQQYVFLLTSVLGRDLPLSCAHTGHERKAVKSANQASRSQFGRSQSSTEKTVTIQNIPLEGSPVFGLRAPTLVTRETFTNPLRDCSPLGGPPPSSKPESHTRGRVGTGVGLEVFSRASANMSMDVAGRCAVSHK